jgi:sporulation protein YlmC with PRC-barrel domain
MMTDRTPAPALIVALACTLPAVCLAAEPAAQPQMYTGYTNRAPRTPTVSESADEIGASQAIGASVRDASGAEVATIGDLIVNRKDAAVELAILEPAGGVSFRHGSVAVAWSSLKFEGKPTPRFVTALSREALASGTPFTPQAQASGNYYDVKTDLLGKTAIGADGAELGRVKDLVLTFGSGRLVALVIDIGGLIGKENYHAVAWDKAQPQGGRGNSPLRLALSKSEVEAAPIMVTQAPRPAPSPPGSTAPMIRQDSTGNVSGTRIPAPPSRR